MRNDFRQLNKIFRNIIYKIYTNQNLCKLLYYQESDCLEKEDIENIPIKLRDNVHNCHYQPSENDKDSKTHLNIIFSDINKTGKGSYLKNKSIKIIVLVHKDNTRLDDGSSRVFEILQELDNSLNCNYQPDNQGFVFKYASDIWLENYSGYAMEYETIL